VLAHLGQNPGADNLRRLPKSLASAALGADRRVYRVGLMRHRLGAWTWTTLVTGLR
jgi:hypothetical protein